MVLTTACNLRCSYCYQAARPGKSAGPGAPGGRMEWSTLRAALDLALSSPERQVNLTFSGGEPLLADDLLRRAVAHVTANRPPGRLVRYTLITNGLLLTEDLAAFLADHDFELQLSFDGVRPAQEQRASGTFDALDQLLGRLRDWQPQFYRRHLKVAMTIIPPTIPYLADSVDYFLAKEVPRITMYPTVTPYPGWRGDFRPALAEQFARIFTSSLGYFERTGQIPVVIFRRAEEKEPAQEEPDASPEGPGCGFPEGATLAVDVDGQVRGCLAVLDSVQNFPPDSLLGRVAGLGPGDVREPCFWERVEAFCRAARQNDLFGHLEDRYSRYGRCRDCSYRDACQTCPVATGYLEGNRDPRRVPALHCAFQKAALSYRERFPVRPAVAHLLRDPELMRAKKQPWLDLAEALREERASSPDSSPG